MLRFRGQDVERVKTATYLSPKLSALQSLVFFGKTYKHENGDKFQVIDLTRLEIGLEPTRVIGKLIGIEARKYIKKLYSPSTSKICLTDEVVLAEPHSVTSIC